MTPKEATNSAIASFAVTIRKDLIADAVWEAWEYGIEPRDQWLHTRAFANEVKIAASLHLRVCLWALDMTRNAPCKQGYYNTLKLRRIWMLGIRSWRLDNYTYLFLYLRYLLKDPKKSFPSNHLIIHLSLRMAQSYTTFFAIFIL